MKNYLYKPISLIDLYFVQFPINHSLNPLHVFRTYIDKLFFFSLLKLNY
jgi:hypothetical protein